MPSTPTTKSQVQAYRFVLRRMQSALVRKDAVMLHDPMRTHSRATIVGLCLGAVGMIGFLIWGLLSPAPKPPTKDGIVIGQPSGAVYVLLNSTPKGQVLIPTFNLASARLLLLSRSSPEAQGVGSQVAEEGDPFGGGAPDAADSPTRPTFIPDNKLEGIARERLTGIQDAPQLLPEKPEQRISDNWAVCDQYQLDPSLVDPASEDKIKTTVIGGVAELGAELATNEALLVQAPTKKHYLVYRTPESANVRNTSTVRAEVDITNRSVTAALGLNEKDVRQITAGLLNAIPEAAPLTAPRIAGAGEPTTLDMGVDLVVGSVFQVEVADGWEYYAVLREGVHKIKASTANLIRFDKTVDGAEIPKVTPDRLPGNLVQNVIQEADFPANLPEVLTPTNLPVACLGWALVGEAPNQVGQTKVFVGKQLPVPLNAAGQPAMVDISTASDDGDRIDHFYMPPGKAAVVRGSHSPADFAVGPIYVISDRGVKYGIPDLRTAKALNLPEQTPAPDAIVRLLPNGASLNASDVLQTYDTVPVKDGQFAEQPPAEGQTGG